MLLGYEPCFYRSVTRISVYICIVMYYKDPRPWGKDRIIVDLIHPCGMIVRCYTLDSDLWLIMDWCWVWSWCESLIRLIEETHGGPSIRGTMWSAKSNSFGTKNKERRWVRLVLVGMDHKYWDGVFIQGRPCVIWSWARMDDLIHRWWIKVSDLFDQRMHRWWEQDWSGSLGHGSMAD